MSLTIPKTARGPVIELELPESEQPLKIVLRNNTTGKSLRLLLSREWVTGKLILDFFRRTIVDQTGADQSGLLDPTEDSLWTTEPVVAGVANDLEIEVIGGAVIAKDSFLQAGGAATGVKAETSPGGLSYVALANSDTTDFEIDGVNDRLVRTATSDTGTLALGAGRAIGLDLNLADTEVVLDLDQSGFPAGTGPSRAVLLRLVNNLNFAFAEAWLDEGDWHLRIGIVKAGVVTPLDGLSGVATDFISKTFTMSVTAVGSKLIAQYKVGAVKATIQGEHTDLAAAGALAKGDVYIYDEYEGITALSRYYDNLRVRDFVTKATYAAKATARWDRGYY